jgi:hypothetical protein
MYGSNHPQYHNGKWSFVHKDDDGLIKNEIFDDELFASPDILDNDSLVTMVKDQPIDNGLFQQHAAMIPITPSDELSLLPSLTSSSRGDDSPHDHVDAAVPQQSSSSSQSSNNGVAVSARGGRTSFVRLNVGAACSLCHSQKTRCCGKRPCEKCIHAGRAERCVDRPRQRKAAHSVRSTTTPIATTDIPPVASIMTSPSTIVETHYIPSTIQARTTNLPDVAVSSSSNCPVNIPDAVDASPTPTPTSWSLPAPQTILPQSSTGMRKRARGNDEVTTSPTPLHTNMSGPTSYSVYPTSSEWNNLDSKAPECGTKFGLPPFQSTDIHHDLNYDFELAMIDQSAWFIEIIETAVTTRCAPIEMWYDTTVLFLSLLSF